MLIDSNWCWHDQQEGDALHFKPRNAADVGDQKANAEEEDYNDEKEGELIDLTF